MNSALVDLLELCERLSPDDLRNLPPEMRDELLTMAGRLPPLLWTPYPGPQTAAFHSPADELFYGGAAGGGKTDLLIGLGVTAHRKSLILRRQATQLPEVTARIKEVCTGVGQWRGSGHGGTMTGLGGGTIHLPGGGRMSLPGGVTVELAGCDHEDDKQKYKGRAHDLKAFDELPDFSESQYEFIGAWTRTSDPTQRCRRVGAGNPPTTAEGEWIIRRWAPWLDAGADRKARAGELIWYARIDGKEVEVEGSAPIVHKRQTILPWSRTFIPARVEDNPVLMAAGYVRTLDMLPEPLRSQYRFGDFTASRIDDAFQVIPSAWVRAAQERWVADPPPGYEWLSAVGVDVARGGADRTVLAPRRKNWFAPPERYPGSVTPDGDATAALVAVCVGKDGKQDSKSAAVNVDVIGVGAAAYDACRRLGLNAYPVNASAEAYGRDRAGVLEFVNLRAYAWWALRDALNPQTGDGLMLPPDPELLADLTAPRWEARAGGIKIEGKDDIRERIGRSPDVGDAVVLAHLQTAAKNEIKVLPRQTRPVESRRGPVRALFGRR